MLEQSGWEAVRGGHAQAAADAFREAIALDPTNARLHMGAGTAAFLLRRDEEARAELDTALDLDPRLTRARAQLGQTLRRMGDLRGAIQAYEVLTSDEPTDRVAADTLARWRREADLHDRMRLAVGNHFTVSFDGPEVAGLAAQALASLDLAFWRICFVMDAFPPNSVPVVLYSAEQFRDITRSPPWAAGAYDGTIRVPMRGALESAKELDRVLAHEFAHALIRSLAMRDVPTWLNEGLASALESEDLEWAMAIVRGAKSVPSLADLRSSFGKLSGDEARLAYAVSAIAARTLLDEAGGAAMANLLRDLGEGIDFDAAFLHRLQRTFADFQASLPVP